jgi:hypothetical protein
VKAGKIVEIVRELEFYEDWVVRGLGLGKLGLCKDRVVRGLGLCEDWVV